MVREGGSSRAGVVGEFLKGERGLAWAWTLEREKNPGKPCCAGVTMLVPEGEGRFWREIDRPLRGLRRIASCQDIWVQSHLPSSLTW